MPASRPPRLGRLLALSLFGPLALEVVPPFFFARFGRPDMVKSWPHGALLAWAGFLLAAACLYLNERARRQMKPATSLLSVAAFNGALWMLVEFGGRAKGPLSPLFSVLSQKPEPTAFALALTSALGMTAVLAARQRATLSRAAMATHLGICLFAASLLGYYILHPGMFTTA